MATEIEIKYFNTFWLKKVVDASGNPLWPGLPWNPTDYPVFPSTADTTTAYDWIIEEARIEGGFNNTPTNYGVKAYLVESSNEQTHRYNTMIYSGIYNSTTDVNNTNVFSVGEAITKSVNPDKGSIQKLYAEDTNLIVFQENKVSRALIDKDTIYTTESGTQTQAAATVIGQAVPYVGEYGISTDPSSFAVYGYRKYFTDKNRGCVLRLSRDGMTEISNYGMYDYFRDNLSTILYGFQEYAVTYTFVFQSQTSASGGFAPLQPWEPYIDLALTGVGPELTDIEPGMFIEANGTLLDPSIYVKGVNTANGRVYLSAIPPTIPGGATLRFIKYVKDSIQGSWDIHQRNYTLSLQKAKTSTTIPTYSTLSFDESVLGWTSFYTYNPTFMGSLKNKFYSFYNAKLWEHYDELTPNNRGLFYDVRSEANVIFILNNNPSINKNFNTLAYEGGNGWQVDYITSDEEGIDPTIPLTNPLTYSDSNQYQDSTNSIKSYDEGRYLINGAPFRAGFDRKENKYVANLVNASSVRPGEIIFGTAVGGIKGYFATIKMSTDSSTNLGGMKELFAVSSNFDVSSY